jgi:V/A-type H+/Na+-transporting ATPase subunit I
MFRPAKIHHSTVMISEDKANSLMDKLYEQGICQIKKSKISNDSEFKNNLADISNRLNIIIHSLEHYKPVVQPENRLKSILFPKPAKKEKTTIFSEDNIVKDINTVLNKIENDVLKTTSKIIQMDENITNKNIIIENLRILPDIKTNMLKSTQNISVLVGLINSASLELLKKEELLITVKEIDKSQSLIAIFTSPEEKQKADKLLHSVGFQPLEIPFQDNNPNQLIEITKKEINHLEKDKKTAKEFLTKTSKDYNKNLELLHEELNIVNEKCNTFKNIGKTSCLAVIEAWVPDKDLDKFHETVKKTSPNYYIEAEEEKDAPTLFNNPKLVKPFELITELYSVPKYKSLDPTPILAITFTLFFGFMLTDVAYGLMLILIGWLMLRGDKESKFGMLMFIFGFSTVFMGIIFGSYFGDFFTKLGWPVPVPIDAMKQVMLTLYIAVGLGAIHLITGLALGFYENIHDKKIKDAFSSQGVWLIFILGAAMFILQLNTIGMVLLVISVVMQVGFKLMEGGPVTGVLSVFDFSGFLGDLFSYARLMALALGTAGIALAVNFMVFMAIDLIPVVGIILAILIFIVGHLFNMVMNGLGAFIHTTRLHFLEFFTKFYDGGGNSYKPFMAKRKKTYVEEV